MGESMDTMKKVKFVPPEIMKKINSRRNKFTAKAPSTYIFEGRAPMSFNTAMNFLYIIGKGYLTSNDDLSEKWRKELAESYKQELKDKKQELIDIHEIILEDETIGDDIKETMLNNIERDIRYYTFLESLADTVRENLSGLKKKSRKDIEFIMRLRDQRIKHLDSQKRLWSIPKIAGILGISVPTLTAMVENFSKIVKESIETTTGVVSSVLTGILPLFAAISAVLANLWWDNHIEKKKVVAQKDAEKMREDIDQKKLEETKKILALAELKLIGHCALSGYLEDLKEIAPDKFINLVKQKKFNDVELIINEAANIIETGYMLPEDVDRETEKIIIDLAVRVINQSVELHKRCSEILARYCKEKSRIVQES